MTENASIVIGSAGGAPEQHAPPASDSAAAGYRGRLWMLARSPPRALARYDDTGHDQFPAPHAPWLGALHGSGQACRAYRAVRADGLGPLDLGRRLGEEQVRVDLPARQVAGFHVAAGDQRGRHGTPLSGKSYYWRVEGLADVHGDWRRTRKGRGALRSAASWQPVRSDQHTSRKHSHHVERRRGATSAGRPYPANGVERTGNGAGDSQRGNGKRPGHRRTSFKPVAGHPTATRPSRKGRAARFRSASDYSPGSTRSGVIDAIRGCGDQRQHVLAVPVQLGLPDSWDSHQLGHRAWPRLRDGGQRRVGEHHERWLVLLARPLYPPLSQPLEQPLVPVGRTALAAPQLALDRGRQRARTH